MTKKIETTDKKMIGTGDKHIQNPSKSVNQQWVKECEEYIDKHLKKELSKIDGVFLPGDNFYLSGDPREVLVYMAVIILDWLNIKLKKGELVIDFYDEMEPPGLYTEIDGQQFILVNSKYSNDTFAMGAILAHELMHFYLIGRKKLIMEDTLENELLTDLCTIEFGLGLPIINGMSYSNSWLASILLIFVGVFYWSSSKLSFGYFNPNQYGSLTYKNLEKKKLSLEEVGGYIRPSARTFLSQGIGSFWKVKKKSNYIHALAKRKKIWLAIKLSVLAVIIGWFSWSASVDSTKETELLQQKTYIERLEEYVLANEDEAAKLMNELEKMATQLEEYEAEGNEEAYNELAIQFMIKMKAANHYIKQLDEYEKQIDDYNSKL